MIFLTASKGFTAKSILEETRARGYLIKPFEPEALLEVVRQWLRK